jgi:hypothetical protein
MKAKNIIGAGICSILLASSPLVSGQDVKKEVSKDILETLAKQDIYISKGQNYSLERSPGDFGFELTKSTTEVDSTFRDIYESPVGYQFIFCSKTNGELDSIFNKYMQGYTLMASNAASGQIIPRHVEPIGEGIPKSIVVDNNPALTGSVDLLCTPIKDYVIPSQLKDAGVDSISTIKYTVRLTLFKAKDRLYTIASFTLQEQLGTILADKFYNNSLKTFEALK